MFLLLDVLLLVICLTVISWYCDDSLWVVILDYGRLSLGYGTGAVVSYLLVMILGYGRLSLGYGTGAVVSYLWVMVMGL